MRSTQRLRLTVAMPALLLAAIFCSPRAAGADDVTDTAAAAPITEAWDYAGPMKKVAARFTGQPGVVIHVGDSITYANPYGQWARYGKGKTPDDQAILKWMHINANDDTDGWFLARVDRPGFRSDTACPAIRIDEMLTGGKNGLPALADILRKYRPQIVVLLVGTNDATTGRPVDDYRADMTRGVDLILAANAICILTTIPPHPSQPDLARSYNQALRQLAKARGLPVIDFEREILRRRPDDWNGTLLGRNDVHPSVQQGEVNSASEPTADNLRNIGYLLRGVMTVRKIAEVKRRAIDAVK